MLGLTANKAQALSATNRQNNKRCFLRAHIEQTVNAAHHSCSDTVLSRLRLSALYRSECVCVCVVQACWRKSFFYHLSDLNSVSSCTVIISWALQVSKDQCSWCLPPPEKGPIIAPVHISRALQPVSHTSYCWFMATRLMGVRILHILTVTHSHTHTHTHTHTLRHTQNQRGANCSWPELNTAAPEVAKPVFKGTFITLTAPFSPAD